VEWRWDVVRAAVAVVILFMVLGVAYFVARQFEAHGLQWPSFFNILLLLIALAAIFIIIVGLWSRLGGPGAGR
jgi:formate hydrogenlyase subunit 3/multisubunit Na+/H+ antiporter MnhD subunit